MVDEKRNLLWVCSGKSGFTTVPQFASALKAYRLQNGKPVASYAMPDNGYCNDIAIDNQHNVYVTDSFNPRILKFNFTQKRLQPWLDSKSFLGQSAYKGLNGIAIQGNKIFVSKVEATNDIAEVTIDDKGNPKNTQWLKSSRELKNVDAVRVIDNHRLLLTESDAFGLGGDLGGQLTIATINEDDATISVNPLISGLTNPSSATIMNNKVYYIQSKYSLLTKMKEDKANPFVNIPFSVESIRLN